VPRTFFSERHMSDSSRTGTSGRHQDAQRTTPQGGLPDPELSQDEIEEIEAERERRLDPANRPENAVVDNTDKEFDFERGELVDKGELEKRRQDKVDDADSAQRKSGQGPLPDPEEMSEAEIEEIEAERERRLDPANRPENAEVDNTDKG
jgi:hypothetical protein